jgi:prepilin-type N-terminal cleavage/methylation domain-containing protein
MPRVRLQNWLRVRAFTLIELLVVIAIIGILIALLLPAVQKIREAAARMSSTNNLKQLGLAAHNYANNNPTLPNNGTAQGSNNYRTWCWAFQLLPYVEQAPLYTAGQNGVYDQVGVKTYLCPGRSHTPFSTTGGSNPNFNGPHTDYAINDVSFGTNKQLSLAIVSSANGTSNTVLFGEKSLSTDRGYSNTATGNWDECIYSGGYGGTSRGSNIILKDGPVGSASTNPYDTNNWGSPFSGGGLFCLGDGSVRPISFSLSGSAAFTYALQYNNNIPFTLDQ